MSIAISPASPLVALVGGSGFIGTAVAEAFAAAGWRIVAVGRTPENARHLKPLGDLGQIGARQADVRAPATLARALAGADAVVNLVGIFAERRRQSWADIHIDGARAVALAAAAVGARALVHVSAIGADAHSNWGYGRSKGLGEQAVRAAFPTATIVRPGIAYGATDRFTNRLAGTIASLPAPVMPVIAPEARLQPVFVHNVAAAIVQIVTAQMRAPQAPLYELAGPEIFSMRELISWIADFLGVDRPLVDTPDIWARLLARFSFLPGSPISASDLEMLQHDNVAAGDCPGFTALGITPATLATTAPGWLFRYRAGGRFALSA